MTKRDDFPRCKDSDTFMKMQRALFSSRRKTVKNNLTAFLSNAEKASLALEKAGIDEKKRAEQLSIEELLRLSDCVLEVR